MLKRGFLFAVLFFTVAGVSAFGGRLETIQSGTTKDLHAAAYHPSDSYALVVGDGVFKYDASGLVMLSNQGPFFDVAWRPQGDFALLVGDFGAIYEYDGAGLTPLASPASSPLYGVAFSPSGDQAVIVGYDGAFIIYENGALTDRSIGSGHFLEGVTWKPDGTSALAAGILNYASEEVIRWDRSTVVVEWSGPSAWPGGISYHPTDGYALIVEDWGHAATYSGSAGYAALETGFEQMTDGLNSVKWSPDGSEALITGAWYHGPFPGLKTFVAYDGKDFNVLRMFENGDDIYEGAAWKSDSAEALVVGDEGELAVYRKTPSILGRIYCDKENYAAGETMKTFVDLENNGSAPCAVDAYISVWINYGQRLWWPKFGFMPFPVALNLKPGASISGFKVFETVIGPVTYQKNFVWEFWILESGSMNYESVLSYSPFQGYVVP